MRILRAMFFSLMFFSAYAWAIEIGNVQVSSKLTQPLHAEVSLTDVDNIPLDKIHITLGDEQAYEQLGIPYTDLVAHLHLQLTTNKENQPVFLVTSDQPAEDPIVEFVVMIEGGTVPVMRRVSLFIDPLPPSAMATPAPSTETPSIQVAPAAPEAAAAITSPTPPEEDEPYTPDDLIGVYEQPAMLSQAYTLSVGEEAEVLHDRLVPEVTLPTKIKAKMSSPVPGASTEAGVKEGVHWYLLFFYLLLFAGIAAAFYYREYILPYWEPLRVRGEEFYRDAYHKIIAFIEKKKKSLPSKPLIFTESTVSPPPPKPPIELSAEIVSTPVSKSPAIKESFSVVSSAELDPIDEATVYLNYGRYAEAAAILKAASAKAPQRNDLTIKLLEVYVAAKMSKEFDTLYHQLPRTLEVSDPALKEKADALAQKIGEMAEKGEADFPSEVKGIQPIYFVEDPENNALTLAQAFIKLGGQQEANAVLEMLAKSSNEGIQKQAKQLLSEKNVK